MYFTNKLTNQNFYLFQEKLKKVPGFKPSRCNNMIKMESPKVVDTLDIEDMGDKVSFCVFLYSLIHRKLEQKIEQSLSYPIYGINHVSELLKKVKKSIRKI